MIQCAKVQNMIPRQRKQTFAGGVPAHVDGSRVYYTRMPAHNVVQQNRHFSRFSSTKAVWHRSYAASFLVSARIM